MNLLCKFTTNYLTNQSRVIYKLYIFKLYNFLYIFIHNFKFLISKFYIFFFNINLLFNYEKFLIILATYQSMNILYLLKHMLNTYINFTLLIFQSSYISINI